MGSNNFGTIEKWLNKFSKLTELSKEKLFENWRPATPVFWGRRCLLQESFAGGQQLLILARMVSC